MAHPRRCIVVSPRTAGSPFCLQAIVIDDCREALSRTLQSFMGLSLSHGSTRQSPGDRIRSIPVSNSIDRLDDGSGPGSAESRHDHARGSSCPVAVRPRRTRALCATVNAICARLSMRVSGQDLAQPIIIPCFASCLWFSVDRRVWSCGEALFSLGIIILHHNQDSESWQGGLGLTGIRTISSVTICDSQPISGGQIHGSPLLANKAGPRSSKVTHSSCFTIHV
jgi:hypothetical protein